MKRTVENSTTVPPNGSNRMSNFSMETHTEQSQPQNIENEHHGLKDRAVERAVAIKDKATAQAAAIGERVSEGASALTERVSEGASALTERASRAADDLTTSVGKRISSYSESLRGNGEEGVSGRAAHTLETVGTYLQQSNVEAMAHDVTNVIRRHPVESILLGVGVGFLLGRMLSR